MSGGSRGTMLSILDTLPEGLLECEAHELHRRLAGPALIHLKGAREQPLFVSVLLHGNEVTGWQAVRSLLQKYQNRTLPRSLSLLIGNVEAAREGLRVLPQQLDFNRVWKGELDGPIGQMARQVMESLRELSPFASVDVHNNTGLNPHYACVNVLAPAFLHLASLFGRTVVYFTTPDSVMSRAMAGLCPAVTIECGKPGMSHGEVHVEDYLESCLHLEHFHDGVVVGRDVDLYHTVAVVKVLPGLSLGIEDEGADLNLPADLDHSNFRELPSGTRLARLRPGVTEAVVVTDDAGRDVTARYFNVDAAGNLGLVRPVMPSMLTLDTEIIKQDCLCYLMERLPQTKV